MTIFENQKFSKIEKDNDNLTVQKLLAFILDDVTGKTLQNEKVGKQSNERFRRAD